ncbi:hypothetical protein NTGHW29_140002 [Candidatus Nitrotoga sp. HW29]|nr:hypothetical protein NTGHW29_140002 [Candidatus Nitrotoga sp. HW29]
MPPSLKLQSLINLAGIRYYDFMPAAIDSFSTSLLCIKLFSLSAKTLNIKG